MKNIIFLGTNHFAALILRQLIKNKIKISYVITKNDKKMGRGQKIKHHPVKNIAIKNNIQIYTTTNINQIETQNIIKNIHPELIIMTDYGQKINTNIINIPQYGIINIHPSILPKLRGATPIQHAIINGEIETGVSIIKINNILDSGDILNTITYKLKSTDTYLSLSLKLAVLGSRCLISVLKNIKTKNIKIKKQCHEKSSYTSKLTNDFYKINWNDAAIDINRKIRASYGIKKISVYIKKHEIKIIKTKIVKQCTKIKSKAGEIIKINTDGIDIATKNDIIRITHIQIPGKKMNSIKNILNSNKNLFQLGDKLK